MGVHGFWLDALPNSSWILVLNALSVQQGFTVLVAATHQHHVVSVNFLSPEQACSLVAKIQSSLLLL
jgi:hypothetical protein